MRFVVKVEVETESEADAGLIEAARRRARAQSGDPETIRTVADAFVEFVEFIDEDDLPLADAGFEVLSIETEALP